MIILLGLFATLFFLLGYAFKTLRTSVLSKRYSVSNEVRVTPEHFIHLSWPYIRRGMERYIQAKNKKLDFTQLEKVWEILSALIHRNYEPLENQLLEDFELFNPPFSTTSLKNLSFTDNMIQERENRFLIGWKVIINFLYHSKILL